MRRQTYRWILSAAAVAIWLTASGCGNSDDSGSKHRQGGAAAKIEEGLLRGAARGSKGSQAEIQKAYAVMRTPPEPMSSGMRATALETIAGGPGLGLRFDLAQHLKTPVGGLWAVDGSKGVICLFRDDLSAGSCGIASGAVESGMVLEVYKRTPPHGRLHDFRMFGIAPSWARAVRIRTGEKELTIRVADNAFGYRAEHPIRIVDLVR